ncbi:MAG: tetratricopeptide repeat protein [bacterium]
MQSRCKSGLKIFGRIGILSLAVLLFLNLSSVDGYAQKKKKKGKNHQIDLQAEKQKYLFELTKFWSFGHENFKNKQYADAKKHFWTVVKLDTIDKFKRVYRYLGDSYYKLEDPDSAQYIYELGIQKYPKNIYLHRMVAFLLNARGQVEDAIPEYETILELDPEAKDDWMRLAALYVKVDRIEDAIAAYDKVLALDPENLEAQNNKTALIASTGDIEAVIAEKEKIREKDPQNTQVRFDLGKMYFDQGDYETSIARYSEYLTLSPGDVMAIRSIGIAYQRLERYTKAIEQFKAVVGIEPDNKEILCEISRTYKELGQFRTARNYANKALALDNSYGLGWIALGEVYEACADRCVENNKGGKVDFNDKLIYDLADSKYRRALSDPQFLSETQRHRNFLKAVLPSKQDKFMHKGQTKATGDCYTWIY